MVAARGLGSSINGRSTPNTPSSETPSTCVPDDEESVIGIAPQGDLVLRIEHIIDETTHSRSFRVSSGELKAASKYFNSLLLPGRFSEASIVDSKHESIRAEYGSIAEAPSDALPVILIHDLGRIQVKSIGSLLADFLHILHSTYAQAFSPVSNLANLAIVADRFDALDFVKTAIRRKKLIRAQDGKTTTKAEASLSEERVRQRLLVGLLLDDPIWLERYSVRLIVKGWVGKEASTAAALWWDTPMRIEEELSYRRDCVLETIQSLQSHFLGLYTSRDRQCKMGYDSSPQCDSFQLGEMMRFFSRIGTLQLRGTIIDSNELPDGYTGDLNALIDTMRQVPEYQIDKYHSHCGIRTRLVPLLDLLQKAIVQAGVCAECWQEGRGDYAWTTAKRPLMWKRAQAQLHDRGHRERHPGVRELFTAVQREWD